MPYSLATSVLRRRSHHLPTVVHRLSSVPQTDPAGSKFWLFMKYLTAGLAIGNFLRVMYWYRKVVVKGTFDVVADYPIRKAAGAAAHSGGGAFSKRRPFSLTDDYRRKVFFNYEKRIRLRSPPEKVYEYFATFTRPDGKLLMTPGDLMRAVVPVFPPSGSNIIRDGYLRGEKCPGSLRCAPSEFFLLFDINNDGLISFKEYIFFVTLLSIPESSFSVAFKMFDKDGNGEIDREEFKKVMTFMRAANRQGFAQRDGHRAGSKVGGSVENGGLVEHFFGKDGTKLLQHDTFVQFLRDLHHEIVRLEFAHYDITGQGSIPAKDFAFSMVASAGLKHVGRLLDQVAEIDNDPHLSKVLISEDEFTTFDELRKELGPLSWALFSFGKINGLLRKEDFQRAASQVCGVHLTENVVDIIFHLFDEDRDGSLSIEEFVKVLERRHKDMTGNFADDGLLAWFGCCWNCAKSHSPSFIF